MLLTSTSATIFNVNLLYLYFFVIQEESDGDDFDPGDNDDDDDEEDDEDEEDEEAGGSKYEIFYVHLFFSKISYHYETDDEAYVNSTVIFFLGMV